MADKLMTTWGRSTSLSIVDLVMDLFDPKSVTTPLFSFFFSLNISLISITDYGLEIDQVALTIV